MSRTAKDQPKRYARRCPKCRKRMKATYVAGIVDGIAFTDMVIKWACDRCELVIGRDGRT